MKQIKIGVIGFGTIGSGVVRILKKRAELIKKKHGINLILKYVCDLDIKSSRNVSVDKKLLTTDFNRVIDDKEVDIVVELIGGIHPAKEIVLKALKNKKSIVTANKALLAEEGELLFKVANQNGVNICFEASVAGGIPIIKSLREGLVTNQINAVYGIINGTSNYILSQMTQKGCDFKLALREAKDKGYAEKDPLLDINGMDSAHKIAILAKLCFDQEIDFKKVYFEGIDKISLSDIKYADELGYCIKLLAIAKRLSDSLEIRVHPTLLPKKHLLSKVQGVFNAIHINADFVGDMLLYGQGAGQMPTASAVMSDILDIAIRGEKNHSFAVVNSVLGKKRKPIKSINDIETRYYLRFLALDNPGVLSRIAEILGKHKISIYSVIQKGRRLDKAVPIVMMVQNSKEKNLRRALAIIDKLSIIKRKTIVIRVERG